jgi:rhodanese-related sulfurtransferase
MKKLSFFNLSLILIVSILSGCSEPSYTNIDNEKLKQLTAEGIPVIDIRRAEEWKQTGIIEGSHKLTAFDKHSRFNPEFMTRFRSIVNKEQPVILICRTGNRTSALAEFLSEKQGFIQVYNVKKGITGWIREGKPIKKI